METRRWVLAAALLTGIVTVAFAVLGLSKIGTSAAPISPGNIGLGPRDVARSPADPWLKLMADIDGDAREDLVVSGANGPLVWYRNPTWSPVTISSVAATQSGGASGDIDGDGDLDVTLGTTWYENTGRGRGWRTHRIGAGGNHDVVLVDLDRDGHLDVAMRGEVGSQVDVQFQEGKRAWRHVALDPGVGRNGLDAGDLDRDGDTDLVIGGRWLVNPGGARARSSAAWAVRDYGAWNDWAAVRAVDIDGNGRLDVVLGVSEERGDIAWFEAPADPVAGRWRKHTVAEGLDSVHRVEVADMNDDGKLDVVASEFRGAGRLLVALNQDRARSWGLVTVTEGANLHNVAVGDVNGDRLPDVFGAAPFGRQPLFLYVSNRARATRVLVFSRTRGFRHESIPDAVTSLEELGRVNGFAVDATEDSGAFTPENLARYRAVVFLNPSGDVLDGEQRRTFRRYIEAGHGFVGVHNAAALVLEDWPWYTRLIGARYRSEIGTQPMRLVVVDRTHPSTRDLPSSWLITEEAYNWNANPKANGARVLVNLDESSVSGGTMGEDHPFSWYKRYAGGRSWYTTGGANSADYRDEVFMRHLLGGIRWAGDF